MLYTCRLLHFPVCSSDGSIIDLTKIHRNRILYDQFEYRRFRYTYDKMYIKKYRLENNRKTALETWFWDLKVNDIGNLRQTDSVFIRILQSSSDSTCYTSLKWKETIRGWHCYNITPQLQSLWHSVPVRDCLLDCSFLSVRHSLCPSLSLLFCVGFILVCVFGWPCRVHWYVRNFTY